MAFILRVIAFLGGMASIIYGIYSFTCTGMFDQIVIDSSFLIAVGAYILGTVLLIWSVAIPIISYFNDLITG